MIRATFYDSGKKEEKQRYFKIESTHTPMMTLGEKG
jgi:hypothetical protein